MVKQVFHVTHMFCATCPMRIEELLEEMPGIKRARASYPKEQLILEYDENAVTLEQVRSALDREGYGLELKLA